MTIFMKYIKNNCNVCMNLILGMRMSSVFYLNPFI